jgi:hypothetical protein
MDRYKISQSNIKQQLGRPIKSVRSSSNRIKSINSKQALALIGGALVLIAIGILIGIIFFGSTHKSSQTESGSSLTAASKTNSAISASAYNALTTGVANKNLSILGSYCAPKVHVEIVSSGYNETIGCKQAASLVDSALQNAQNPWNFHLPESDISVWQTGPYGQELSGTNIVGESSNGEIISIGFNNSGQVTTVIVVPVGLLTPTPTSNSATNNTSGSSTSTPSKGSNTSNLPPGNPVPTGAID